MSQDQKDMLAEATRMGATDGGFGAAVNFLYGKPIKDAPKIPSPN